MAAEAPEEPSAELALSVSSDSEDWIETDSLAGAVEHAYLQEKAFREELEVRIGELVQENRELTERNRALTTAVSLLKEAASFHTTQVNDVMEGLEDVHNGLETQCPGIAADVAVPCVPHVKRARRGRCRHEVSVRNSIPPRA